MPVRHPFLGLSAFDSAFFLVFDHNAVVSDRRQGAFDAVSVVELHLDSAPYVLVVLRAELEGLIQARCGDLQGEVLHVAVEPALDEPGNLDAPGDGHAVRGIHEDADVRSVRDGDVHEETALILKVFLDPIPDVARVDHVVELNEGRRRRGACGPPCHPVNPSPTVRK